MREPLALPAVALVAGLLCALVVPPPLGWCLLAAGLLLMIPAPWRWAFAPLSVAAFGAGVLLIRVPEPEAPPRLAARSGENVWLEGCLVERPRRLDNGAVRLLLELVPRARIRVTLPRPGPHALQAGTRLGLAARVREPRNFENPGAFDYRTWLARRHIYWLGAATGQATVLPDDGACRHTAAALLARWRTALLERLESLFAANQYDRAMLAALLLGDDSALEQAWTEPFRRTGTYHLLVVSGAHVSLLAGTLLFLLRRLPGRSAALLTAGAAAWLYALLAGGEPPVLRAAAGFTFYLFTTWLYRRTQLLNVVAAVTIAFLLADPPQLREASFILSFGAVAALGALALPLAERFLHPWMVAAYQLESTRWDAHHEAQAAARRVELRLVAECITLLLRMPGRWACRLVSFTVRGQVALLEVALATAAIQTALAIPMAGWFHRFSFTGVPANLLATFPLTLAIPAGFLALLSGWSWLAAAAALPLHAAAAAAEWLVRWEPELRIPDPSTAATAAVLAALITLGVALRSTGRTRRWALLAGACAVLGGCSVPFLRAAPSPGWLEIDMLDVGDGDALLLRFPDGSTALLDTGGLPVYNGVKPRIDIGEDVVSPYLWRLGLWRLDQVILSHAHADHAGGFSAIAANFRPGSLWTGAAAPRRIPATISHRRWKPGDTAQWGGVRFRALAPAPDTSPAAGNTASLVLLLEYGSHRFLFPGDLERREDRRLVGAGVLAPVHVLKVAHHGGGSSSSEEFLAAVRPRHALISTAGSLPGRPHARVLESLRINGARVWRTDRDGMITVRSDGASLEVRAHGRKADRTLLWPAP